VSVPTARQDEQPQLGFREVWFAVLNAFRREEITLSQLKQLNKQFVGTPASPITAYAINQALERAKEEVVRERSVSQSPSTTGTPAPGGNSSVPSPASSSTDTQGGLPL